MKLSEAERRADPVARLVHDSSAEEFADWMIEYHHLPAEERGVVVYNLRNAFRHHRLQGRLDRSPFWQFMAELLHVSRQRPEALETPGRTARES